MHPLIFRIVFLSVQHFSKSLKCRITEHDVWCLTSIMLFFFYNLDAIDAYLCKILTSYTGSNRTFIHISPPNSKRIWPHCYQLNIFRNNFIKEYYEIMPILRVSQKTVPKLGPPRTSSKVFDHVTCEENM